MKRSLWIKVAISAAIFAVGLELALQFAHVLHGWLRPEAPLRHPGAPAILCVGDSHTYGVKLPSGESYPAQLQALLEARGYEANVINLGIPGQSSSELRQSLPELLAHYHPRAVIILIGSNNEWNRHLVAWSDVEDGAVKPGLPALAYRLWYSGGGSLRTVRLITYVYNQMTRPAIERSVDREGRVYFHDWRGKGPWDRPAAVIDRTRRDLAAIINEAKAGGAEPVLMTYAGQPFSPMGGINDVIREVANWRGVALADNDAAIWPLFMGPDGKMNRAVHDRLFLTDPGETHLAGPGYAIVAQNVLAALVRLQLAR